MDNVYTSFELLLRITNFVGFFPISFNGPARRGILETSCADCIIAAVVVIVNSVLVFFILANNAFVSLDSKILHYGWAVILMSEYIFIFLLHFLYLFRAKNFVKFLHKLNWIDEMVKV